MPTEPNHDCIATTQFVEQAFLRRSLSLEQLAEQSILEQAKVFADVAIRVRGTSRFPWGIMTESGTGPEIRITVDNQERVVSTFASNDYLNLAADPRVHEAICQALERYGVGLGSSRVSTGYSRAHQELEAYLASLYKKESCVILPTGFDAVAHSMQCLLDRSTTVIADRFVHACVFSGAEQSKAKLRTFPHNDAVALKRLLSRARRDNARGEILVVVEGAYSVEGDIANLEEIAHACKEFGALLAVDEAHAIGVLGARGLGVAEALNLLDAVDIIFGTFSKAIGSVGGFVAARQSIIETIIFTSSSSVFSATLPPIIVAGAKRAWEILVSEPELREVLRQNVEQLHHLLAPLKRTPTTVGAAAFPFLIGREDLMFDCCQMLMEKNIFCFPFIYPAAPRGKARFRLSVQRKHSHAQLQALAQGLNAVSEFLDSAHAHAL